MHAAPFSIKGQPHFHMSGPACPYSLALLSDIWHLVQSLPCQPICPGPDPTQLLHCHGVSEPDLGICQGARRVSAQTLGLRLELETP